VGDVRNPFAAHLAERIRASRVRLGISQEELARIAILDAFQEIKRSGLLRFNGEVVEPTFAALRAVEIFEVV
jgi:transcriptional regulator with XRE-family HTH domain